MAHDSVGSLRDELPAHGRWVQRLARSLVRDEASANDLAQEAQLAALRRGPSIRGALAPFLARVTRNFARRGWRDAAHRAARERAVARSEALPGADESAARLEIQRRLVEEMAELEPAVRHALVRRYLDGWSAARVARETGEPAATVRWRLQRGLAELRARLARKCGGDGIDWRLALLPLCGPVTPWAHLRENLRPMAQAGTIQGALTMKAASQVLVAGVVAAAVGLGTWWSVAHRAQPLAETRLEARAAVMAPAGAEEAREAPPLHVEGTREELRAAAPLPHEEVRAAEAAPVPRVRGRCVDEQLVPISRAKVSQLDTPRNARSSSDGGFELVCAPDSWSQCTLVVEAEGYATTSVDVTLAPGGNTELGDVILPPGGTVRGRVLGPDGAPFGGATVYVTDPALWRSLEEVRTSGPLDSGAQLRVQPAASGYDGGFEIAGVAAGSVRLWAGAEGMRYAVSTPLEVRAQRATEPVELRLERIGRLDRITGIVLTPEGEPLRSVSVSVLERAGGGMSYSSATVDEDGRFELVADAHHVYDLSVSDPEDRWASVNLLGVAPGTHDVELRFVEARWIEVRVVAAGGAALEEYELTAEIETGDRHDLLGRARPGPRPDGRARLRVPTEEFLVRVDARGFVLGQQGPFSPDAPPQTLDFELEPEPGVHGRVLAGGKPLAGAKVSLHAAPRGSIIEHQGLPSLLTPRPEDTTSSDSEGRFVLKLRDHGTYYVRAEASGRAAADVGPLELDPRAGKQDVELELGEGGALEGRVLVAPGRDPAGVIVAVNRGDAFPRTIRADVDGGFRFEGLTAGPWHLSRARLEVNPNGGGTSFSIGDRPTVIPFNCTVREGETTYQDLDLRDFEPCELAGVLLVNGSPAGAWGVMAWPGGKEAMVDAPPSTATSADGHFAVTVDEAGALRLSFTPPAELGGQGRIDALIEVRPGANEWSADLAMGKLSGRCLSPVDADEQVLFYVTDKGVTPSCWLPILPGGDGRYVLPFVPAGKGSIRRLGETGGNWGWTTLVETEIVARSERVLDVP